MCLFHVFYFSIDIFSESESVIWAESGEEGSYWLESPESSVCLSPSVPCTPALPPAVATPDSAAFWRPLPLHTIMFGLWWTQVCPDHRCPERVILRYTHIHTHKSCIFFHLMDILGKDFSFFFEEFNKKTSISMGLILIKLKRL